MALFNYANREITAKVVYYGPGVCGKTTSLEYIHERIAPSQRGRLLSLATETDRTIFFDLLPLKLGEIGGFKLRFQLYTVPGQVKYNKTRKLVLQGADAIVFVADSQKNRREANIESFKNLQENLIEQNRNLGELPLVYSYNKRDLTDLLSIEDLNTELNPKGLPYFPSVAIQGVGVMETLESISKSALRDMEQRLTATSGTAEEDEQEGELLLADEALLDLTGEKEEAEEISFSTDELESLQLESDLSEMEQADGSLGEDALETKPIGYDNNIPIEEFEIRDEDVAQTGTLKESEFFNLKDIEEQALRELDEFLEGKDSEEEQGFADFAFGEEGSEDQTFPPKDEGVLDFSLETGAQESPMFDLDMGGKSPAADPHEAEDIGELEFSLDEKPEEEAEPELSFSLDEHAEEESFSLDLGTPESNLKTAETSSDEDELIGFNLEEEPEEPTFGLDSSANGEIESLDLSESDLDLSFGEQSEELPAFTLDEEDERGESTSLSVEEDELISFTLDEESSEGSEESGMFDLSKSALDLTFGEESPKSEAGFFSEQEDQDFDNPDFRITDSVRFEMQVGEEISTGTPFEQQLDQLSSEDIFSGDEGLPKDEFQPEVSEPTEGEQFQTISDEWTRLLVLAKHFYHRGESYRAQRSVSDNILAIMMYYTAIETALKAVASKYETCNPSLASFHLMLESIEEETQKPVAGAKSLRNNIMMMKNRIQLETGYPDDEECELAARISERFLSSLAQDFLTIDFEKLSPVLPRSGE